MHKIWPIYYGRCSKLKKETPSAARFFVCSKCEKATNGAGEVQQEVLGDEAETVKKFCYHGDKLNASGGCKAAVTARTRVVWKKFRECGEILFAKRFFLQWKERYVRLSMLYGRETWCLRENEVAILRRAEKFMVRAMCGVKLVDKRNTMELVDMLGLKEHCKFKSNPRGGICLHFGWSIRGWDFPFYDGNRQP